MFRKLCGESTLKNVVLVTSMWGVEPQDTSEAREEELSSKFFKSALDKGAQMVRYHNTAESAHNIIRMVMGNRPVALQIQRELVDERKDITDTAAGESINPELKKQIRQHQAELKGLRDEMAQALKEKDEEMRRKLEEQQRKLDEWMEKITKASERMAANYAAEKERIEARMTKMEQEAKKREQEEAERRQQLANLVRRLQAETDVSMAHRPRLEQEIKRPQDRVATVVTIPPRRPTPYVRALSCLVTRDGLYFSILGV